MDGSAFAPLKYLPPIIATLLVVAFVAAFFLGRCTP